jgi:hypothetical protein
LRRWLSDEPRDANQIALRWRIMLVHLVGPRTASRIEILRRMTKRVIAHGLPELANKHRLEVSFPPKAKQSIYSPGHAYFAVLHQRTHVVQWLPEQCR